MRFELWLRERLGDGRFVVTNTSNVGRQPGPEHTALALAGAYDVPLGTKFTELVSRRKTQEDGEGSLEGAETVERISLTVVEIEWFRRMVHAVPNGHHAAVRVKGPEVEVVCKRLVTESENVFLSLRQ